MPWLFEDSPDGVARLRDSLLAADFSVRGVSEVLGAAGLAFIGRDEFGPAHRRTQGDSPLETLIRLFLTGAPVTVARVEAALSPSSVADCVDAGVVSVDGDLVTGRVRLWPTAHEGNEVLVPSDRPDLTDRSGDYVLGVGPASMTLAGLTIRQPVARCLDLGTGSGVQALLARAHADQVVATDRNPRAVAFATLAARLNALEDIEVREGDLFAPVTDERFDLIVSNPPFVISPEQRFIYRDSGLAGDEVCRRIVREAPAHLAVGGWCQLLANWAHLRDQHWQDRLAEWVDEIGCDAWIVQSSVQNAETYATTWIGHDYPTEDTSALFDEWMRYYDSIGLDAVGFGLITLRRTERDAPWVCLEELSEDFVLPCGNEIAKTFDRAVWLADHEDDALLGARLVVNADMTLRQTHYAAEGAWVLDETLLQLAHGLHYSLAIDAFAANFVSGCDGVTPVRDLVARLADRFGLAPGDVTPQTLAFARRLIQQGFVTPLS